MSAIEIQRNLLELDNETESESDYFSVANIRQCQQIAATKWDQLVVGALEVASRIDPYKPDLPHGVCKSGNCYFSCWVGFQAYKSVFYSQICSNTL